MLLLLLLSTMRDGVTAWVMGGGTATAMAYWKLSLGTCKRSLSVFYYASAKEFEKRKTRNQKHSRMPMKTPMPIQLSAAIETVWSFASELRACLKMKRETRENES